MQSALAEPQRRFRHIAASGVLFQGGVAAIDTGTLIAALVEGLTGSAVAVGAAAAISRAGWLVPQLFVGYAAQRRARRMPFYSAGAFGRAVCVAMLAGVLASTTELPSSAVLALFFALWTVYAFVGGIVAVPYNDIVARAVPSQRRSRLLAVRFFGGGLPALGVAAAAHRLLAELPFASAYAAIVLLGAVLFLASAVSFVSAGEPPAPEDISRASGLRSYLSDGVAVLRYDRRFQLFLYAQWLSGVATMAFPFYVIEATASSRAAPRVALSSVRRRRGRCSRTRSGAGGATGSGSAACWKSSPRSVPSRHSLPWSGASSARAGPESWYRGSRPCSFCLAPSATAQPSLSSAI